MSKQFPIKYHGKDFVAIVHQGDGSSKGERQHIVTSHTNISIFDETWSLALLKIEIGQLSGIEKKGAGITLKFNDGKNRSIFVEYPNLEKLEEALTPVVENPLQVVSLSPKIIQFLNFDTDKQGRDLISLMKECGTKVVERMIQSPTTPIPLGDILLCYYRFRHKENFADNLPTAALEIYNDMILILIEKWCNVIQKAASFKAAPNAFEYNIRIIINSAADLANLAEPLQIEFSDLLSNIVQSTETAYCSNLIPLCDYIKQSVSEKQETRNKELPIFSSQMMKLFGNISIIAACAYSIRLFPIELIQLSKNVVSFAENILKRPSLKPTEGEFNDMCMQLNKLCNSMQMFEDSKQYQPEYRFVYMAFTILDEIQQGTFDFE